MPRSETTLTALQGSKSASLLQIRPAAPALGAEVSGIDLSQPMGAGTFDRLYRAWVETGLLIIRKQSLTPLAQIAFSRRFGELFVYTRSENAHPGHPEVLVLSNLTRDGRPLGAPASGRYWHSDGHFLRQPPAASILFGLQIPNEGGDTLFANMAAAYQDLSQENKDQLVGLRVIISRTRSRPYNYPNKPPVTEAERAAWPDMDQPLVRTHPATGRKALYIGGNVPWRIAGMTEEESTPLILSLQSHSVGEKYLYRHRWTHGDVLVWDNRTLIHKATAYDQQNERRHMHRTSTLGETPS